MNAACAAPVDTNICSHVTSVHLPNRVAALGQSVAALSCARIRAGVAELVDATGLGPVGRKSLEVRVLSPALGRLVSVRAVKVSAEQARRFLVARQMLAPARSLEGGPTAVLEVFRRLGSI